MNNVFDSKEVEFFYDAILSLKTKEECSAFFSDLCTYKEIEDFSQRMEVASLLKKGINYAEISKKTGASSATISRVNRCLMYGGGGYALILDRLEKC